MVVEVYAGCQQPHMLVEPKERWHAYLLRAASRSASWIRGSAFGTIQTGAKVSRAPSQPRWKSSNRHTLDPTPLRVLLLVSPVVPVFIFVHEHTYEYSTPFLGNKYGEASFLVCPTCTILEQCVRRASSANATLVYSSDPSRVCLHGTKNKNKRV